MKTVWKNEARILNANVDLPPAAGLNCRKYYEMNKVRSRTVLMLMAAMSLFGGCVSNRRPATPSVNFADSPVFAAGDCFEMVVRDFRSHYNIASDGTISLPLVAPVAVAGMTPDEVAAIVRGLYKPDGPREVTVLPCPTRHDVHKLWSPGK